MRYDYRAYKPEPREPKIIFQGKMVLMNGEVKTAEFILTEYEAMARLTRRFAKFEISGVEMMCSEGLQFDEKSLYRFIKYRLPNMHRINMNCVMYAVGAFNLHTLIEKTHLAGLNDTFWVKAAGSDLNWERVSLYDKDFDEKAADAAFYGRSYNKAEAIKPTPELTTAGTFIKCWERDTNGSIILKKAGGLWEREAFSEYYAQQILEALEISHVKYTLFEDEALIPSCKIYTVCKLFTNEETGFIPVGLLAGNDFDNILSYMKEMGTEQAFYDMLIADAIMMNEDRHTGNFGFLLDNKTGKSLGYAPLFDHNLSLMYNESSPEEELLKYKGHRLITNSFASFTDVISFNMISPKMRRRLANMRGFKLKKHDKYNLPDERLEALNSLINFQINKLLNVKP